jgi:putative peptide zinc metalloprotease protein
MTVLRLRDDVHIMPYDGHAESQRFVAGVDGRLFVISAGLAALLDEMRTPATLESIALRASERTGVFITAAELELLLRERVPPLLLQAESDPQPLFGPLRFRVRWWSAELLAPLLNRARVLFRWRVAIAVLAAFLCVEALIAPQLWSFATSEINSREATLGAMLTLFGMALHELGHLAACHRFDARHGGAGVGIYWCVPLFYAEANGAWMLPRRRRAVVHSAGVYLQCAYLTVIGSLYLCVESPALLFAMGWSHVLVLHALNPLFRLDGHWLLADLAGVNDLNRRIRGVVASLRHVAWPGRTDVALAGTFVTFVCAHLSFVLNALAHGLAGTASVISMHALSSVTGHCVALGTCIAIIVAIARVLARSLITVFSENGHDR